ncbi:Isochorismatase family protein YecD [Streptomyces sp. RB5]|uniref:Isochorismatase family protein YecD n=1 Tax=Streptomyces smaragdinus TaxID=2585196 RepID=A0A7K0CLV9_9ACTN|nr:isochorismatase family protein [Streptomyces smaragdinus]MQY14467.1 Isochorismatase family protein YecD [Streptomyces smaragdinus]
MTTALVLIDLMPRIIALPVAPHTGDEVLNRCLELADAFRAQGRPVIQVRVDRPNVAEQPPGSDFAPGVVQDGDVVVVKRSVGAFGTTDLDAQLRKLGVETVVMGGLVTNMGVESTARAASDLGYEVEFVADAMSGLAAEEHDFAVTTIFPRFGRVTATRDYL